MSVRPKPIVERSTSYSSGFLSQFKASRKEEESNIASLCEQESKIYDYHWRHVTPQENDGVGWKAVKTLGAIVTLSLSLVIAAAWDKYNRRQAPPPSQITAVLKPGAPEGESFEIKSLAQGILAEKTKRKEGSYSIVQDIFRNDFYVDGESLSNQAFQDYKKEEEGVQSLLNTIDDADTRGAIEALMACETYEDYDTIAKDANNGNNYRDISAGAIQDAAAKIVEKLKRVAAEKTLPALFEKLVEKYGSEVKALEIMNLFRQALPAALKDRYTGQLITGTRLEEEGVGATVFGQTFISGDSEGRLRFEINTDTNRLDLQADYKVESLGAVRGRCYVAGKRFATIKTDFVVDLTKMVSRQTARVFVDEGALLIPQDREERRGLGRHIKEREQLITLQALWRGRSVG